MSILFLFSLFQIANNLRKVAVYITRLANKFLFLDGTRHVSHSRINTSKYISFPVVKFSHFFIFFSSFLSFSANELFPYDLQMIFAEIFRMVLRMETKAFQFDRGDYLPRAPTIMTVF